MILELEKQRPIDVICLGRAGIDLYANEHNTDFRDVLSFKKYIGGSPANIAVALSHLGAKAGFIGCVSSDGLGESVRDYLGKKGINLKGMTTTYQETRTSLAVTEIKPSGGEVVIYRNNAADLALQEQDIDPNYIASAKCLLISGTALSASPSREATLAAMAFAHASNTRVILDIDYRAYSWESPEVASSIYQKAASLSNVIIGNREEFDVLENINNHDNSDNQSSQAKQRDKATAERCMHNTHTQIVIIKAGEQGSRTYTKDGRTIEQGIFAVSVKKPFGAGDAFAGTFLFGVVSYMSLSDALKMASASAAMNVSSDNCTEAMPDIESLQQFMQSYDSFGETHVS